MTFEAVKYKIDISIKYNLWTEVQKCVSKQNTVRVSKKDFGKSLGISASDLLVSNYYKLFALWN